MMQEDSIILFLLKSALKQSPDYVPNFFIVVLGLLGICCLDDFLYKYWVRQLKYLTQEG